MGQPRLGSIFGYPDNFLMLMCLVFISGGGDAYGGGHPMDQHGGAPHGGMYGGGYGGGGWGGQ